MRTTKKENSLGYDEKANALSIRINAHKAFSNFSLEYWLLNNVALVKSAKMLDIGCGDGNLFPILSEMIGDTGVIVGIDQSEDLLQKASQKKVHSHTFLMKGDMDLGLPFIDESFDCVTSFFAIYYAKDVGNILREIRRVLKSSGQLILVGPTGNNAKELYDFNRMVFGFAMDDKANVRTNRLEKEFYPKSLLIFKKTEIDKIPSKLVFPDKREFIRYYMATLLFEESSIKAGYSPDANKLLSLDIPLLEISKEMVMLKMSKNA
jgi:ubiquinone/menaquinone biosynthesis C-methylase UbiE